MHPSQPKRTAVLLAWFFFCFLLTTTSTRAFVQQQRQHPFAVVHRQQKSLVVVTRLPSSSYQTTTTTTEKAATPTRNKKQLFPTTTTFDSTAFTTLQRNVLELKLAGDRIFSVLSSFLAHTWWLLPLLVLGLLVPLYHVSVLSSLPQTPEFWKLVNVKQHVSATTTATSIAGFLGSNAVYFGSGCYLLFPSKSNHATSHNRNYGIWTLLAGTVSTVFHSVQTIDYRLAEALCYVDHGVAISGVLYFFRHLGRPKTLRTVLLTVAGLLLLCNPVPQLYMITHSLWHTCSAAAAVTWVVDNTKQEGTIEINMETFDFLRNH